MKASDIRTFAIAALSSLGGAAYASGWWAIAWFGVPVYKEKQDNPMILVAAVVGMVTIALAFSLIYFFKQLLKDD